MKKSIASLLICMILMLSAPAMGEGVKLFIGQDLGAVGGLSDYDQGYVDAFSMPDGVTSYTSLPSLDGLFTLADWGAGDVCAQSYVDDPAFDGVDMALGLYMVGQTENIARGLMKTAVKRLGDFIAQSNRTVYLRIGYEFDGAWNGYEPESYIKAFQTIVDTLRDMGVTNVQTVWQSSGNGSAAELLKWYPGDDYVDYMGYSYFDGLWALIGKGILELAREKGKPVFIAEAAPKRDVKTQDAALLWAAWYEPFLRHIKTNSDVIRAVSYINCDWENQRMWRGQNWGDSRLQANDELMLMWRETLKQDIWAVR